MPGNNRLCTQSRLNDSAICQQVALFLQETEGDAQTRDLAIAVVGPEGELIAFGAHTRCPPLPRQLAQRKAWTALRFRRPTAKLAEEVSVGSLRLEVFHDPQLLAMPGGVPVMLDGLAIAGVGVSGLPPELDAELAAQFAQRLIA
ncbi:heme-binding protein [Klebsiella sp. RHBSTW-00484]|uniref:GlcG/HbpS family heme-binding protein n=1 Tax=unclassified Klebsiella TaxID=2608929 RepID=UPI0015E4EF81|nr:MULTISPECIES: heme-binding protein [unclassified Klebsiella]MBA7843584.1 heme-binding protein [Klebsiella sp. RHBSTW-00465]QLO38944.1 heme-binding protein [Klebsiella sp. RHBSTW-00484]QLT78464.1 heme-binding protein [Klebsiella sp. RHBSTW-00464]